MVVGSDLEEQCQSAHVETKTLTLLGLEDQPVKVMRRVCTVTLMMALETFLKTKGQAGGITRHHKPSCCSCSAGEEGCL